MLALRMPACGFRQVNGHRNSAARVRADAPSGAAPVHRQQGRRSGRVVDEHVLPDEVSVDDRCRQVGPPPFDLAPSVLELPHAEATHRLEQLIRSYDPCISCATHFLDLSVTGR